MNRWVTTTVGIGVDARLAIVESIQCLDDVDEKNRLLLTVVVTDLDRHVRLSALEHITVNPKLAYNPMIYQPVNDNCFKVRRKMMQILEDIYKYNPIDGRICAYDLIDQSFRNIVANPDTEYAAKTASLLYILAVHCGTCDYCAKDHANKIISICLDFLSTYEETVKVDVERSETVSGKGSYSLDEYGKRSFASSAANLSISSDYQETKSESFSFSKSEDQYSVESLVKVQAFNRPVERQIPAKPLQASVYKICYQDAKDKRDEYLIRCFGGLGKRCEPYFESFLTPISTSNEYQLSHCSSTVIIRTGVKCAERIEHSFEMSRAYPAIV